MELNKRGLTDLGYLLYLDRYAPKKSIEDYEVGDIVLFKLDNSKVIGSILSIDDMSATIRYTDSDNQINNTTLPLTYLDVPTELDPQVMWGRVADYVASAEIDGDPESLVADKFYELLEDWKFLPGGRILAAAGVDATLSFYNCYVIPSPNDSKAGIFKTANRMAQIMSTGGGVGINISTLRPKYAKTASTNGRSSGAVSWGEIYSFVTGLIEQGGSRRGALMLILNDWHPDIEEFIQVKRDMERITNANISVGISDAFMKAVSLDDSWTLMFPNTSHPAYDSEWDGDIQAWVAKYGYKSDSLQVCEQIRAKDLWHKIVESAWTCAEPGLWFIDRANKYSNSWYYSRLVSTNPCGEQPLPEWGVCNLGAINLAKFVVGDIVDWPELEKCVKLAVRFLDNVITVNHYLYDKNQEQQLGERRVGLGTLGLAEMLIRLKLAYGSPESLLFIDQLYKFIAEVAYNASVSLAKELGPFPKFDKAKYLESEFIKHLPETLQESIAEHGIRNVTLLTQAPTGTTGTMVNTSTGIEPYYFWEWERTGRFGTHKERVAVYDEWLNDNPPSKPLPAWFVAAPHLTPEQHIQVQATIQRWVDSSISKTCNVPHDYTIRQVGELYQLMYQLGCKGGTVYRDKSRSTQVLSKLTDKEAPAKVRSRPDELYGKTYRKNTPVGALYVTINEREDGPFEVFLNVSKAGSELTAQAEALGRLISLILRLPSTKSPQERLADVVAQLRDIGSGRALGFGPNRVGSLPDAVAQVLSDYGHIGHVEGLPEGDETNLVGDICPQCGNAKFYRIEGCRKCFSCGYSEC